MLTIIICDYRIVYDLIKNKNKLFSVKYIFTIWRNLRNNIILYLKKSQKDYCQYVNYKQKTRKFRAGTKTMKVINCKPFIVYKTRYNYSCILNSSRYIYSTILKRV